MANEKKKIVYSEPVDFFPKEIRRKNKLGEFAEPEKKTSSKKTAPKPVKRGK